MMGAEINDRATFILEGKAELNATLQLAHTIQVIGHIVLHSFQSVMSYMSLNKFSKFQTWHSQLTSIL